jgi:secreted trypsin-like serine protease
MELKVFLLFVLTVQVYFVNANDPCGQRGGVGGLIYGGEEVKRGDWPWTVAFVHKTKNTFFCGGNLVSSKHVLSSK